MNRVGCHFRQTIVDSARQTLQSEGLLFQEPAAGVPGQPEPIPNSQTEINRQADAVLRDLFPRIPNTDRHEIIAHAFKKVRNSRLCMTLLTQLVVLLVLLLTP